MLTVKVSWILEPDDLSRSFLGSWAETLGNVHEECHEEDGEELWRLHSVGPFQSLNQEALPSWGVLEGGGSHISPSS